MAQVGLIFGGRSTEHRVSVTSARTIAEGLEGTGHEVLPFAIAEDGAWADPKTSAAVIGGELDAVVGEGRSARETLHHFLEAPVDVAFPSVHGTWGEDGAPPGVARDARRPLRGSRRHPELAGDG